MTSDEQQNGLVHSLQMPVAEFEGEMVRLMFGKIPAITLEMDHGYARGTHLKLELEVRVRKVSVDEVNTGPYKGDLYREHLFALEEARIIGAYTADELDPGVGGDLAATGADVEEETDDHLELEGEGHDTNDPGF